MSIEDFVKGMLELKDQLGKEVEAKKSNGILFDSKNITNIQGLTRQKIIALPIPAEVKVLVLQAFDASERIASVAALLVAKSRVPVRSGTLRDALYVKANGATMELAAHLPKLIGFSKNMNYFDLVSKGTAGYPQIIPKTRQALAFHWDRAKGLKNGGKSGILHTPTVRGLSGLLRTPRAGANSTLVFFKRIKARRGARPNDGFILAAQTVYEKRFKDQLAIELLKVEAKLALL